MGKGQLKPSLNTTTHLLDWGEGLTIPSANVVAEQLEYPCIAARNEKWLTCFGKYLGSSSESYTYTYYTLLVNPLLDTTEMETYVQTKTRMQMFIVDLPITVKSGNKSNVI